MRNILEYLEKNVRKYPNKIAVIDKDNSISFNELHIKAKKLANLIDKSIVNEPIGVLINRNINSIVYFMSVLYSGNYYVPIDIDMKYEKLKSIFDETNFKYIIGDIQNKEIINGINSNYKYISLDDIKDDTNCIFLPNNIGDLDPAYMIYTSGSTGKPKGVLKSHKAVISFIESYTKTFDFQDDDVIGNQTPFFFDASSKDIYLMLKEGLTLDIIPSEIFSMPTSLIEHLNDKNVSFISWVPTALSIVAQLNPFSYVVPKYLRKVFFVGEVMPIKYLNKWKEYLPNIEYVNLYGQSEIAGICCYYRIEKKFNNDDMLPIGKPLENCQIYLLDNDNIINEPNKVGEVYIVSDALANGYYKDEEKTNNSFIMKDFGNGFVRTFKTGDFAKYDEDFNLLFASRSDSQIKHMGYRIELGEIETVANSLKEINRCCCLYNNDKHKIVLFVETNNMDITDKEIQSILRTKLSTYMVPNKIKILNKLPINQNGKINRQELKNLL